MPNLEPTYGDEFPVTRTRNIVFVIIGAACLTVGVVLFLVREWLVNHVGIQQMGRQTLLGTAGVVFSFGVLLVLGGIWGLVSRERLVVGDSMLQTLVGRARVFEQVPYDNIEAIALESKAIGGLNERFISIKLKNPDDPQTDIGGPRTRQTVRSDYGCDAVIKDRYRVSLDEIHERLSERWKDRTRRK